MQRIGGAALPLGLMAVGAGLAVSGVRGAPGLAATLLFIRHALLPLVAIGLCLALHLGPAQSMVVVLFSALPTAASTYVNGTVQSVTMGAGQAGLTLNVSGLGSVPFGSVQQISN